MKAPKAFYQNEEEETRSESQSGSPVVNDLMRTCTENVRGIFIGLAASFVPRYLRALTLAWHDVGGGQSLNEGILVALTSPFEYVGIKPCEDRVPLRLGRAVYLYQV